MKKLSQQITYWLGVVAIGLVVGLSLQFVQAWTEPAGSAPTGNVGAPINTSGTGQIKTGGVVFNTGGASTGLIVDQGNVGIGIGTPNEKLEVAGGIKIGNTLNDVAGTVRWTGTDFEGYTGTQWVSLTGGAGGGTGIELECLNSGGVWDSADSLCYFPRTSIWPWNPPTCGIGWVQEQDFSTTRANSCSGCTSCRTSEHYRENNGSAESCRYASGDPQGGIGACQNTRCYATKTEIGCKKQ